MPEALDLIWVILVLLLVFYLAWLVTRYVAGRAKGKAAGRTMRVVDRLNLSNDKAILVVKIGEEYCVIGMTGHEIRLIKTLSQEEAEPFRAEAEKQEHAWQDGPVAGITRGLHSFSERLGFAMRRPGGSYQRKPYADSDYEQDAEPDDAAAWRKTGEKDEDSVINMMNERIKLRKETKRH